MYFKQQLNNTLHRPVGLLKNSLDFFPFFFRSALAHTRNIKKKHTSTKNDSHNNEKRERIW